MCNSPKITLHCNLIFFSPYTFCQQLLSCHLQIFLSPYMFCQQLLSCHLQILLSPYMLIIYFIFLLLSIGCPFIIFLINKLQNLLSLELVLSCCLIPVGLLRSGVTSEFSSFVGWSIVNLVQVWLLDSLLMLLMYGWHSYLLPTSNSHIHHFWSFPCHSDTTPLISLCRLYCLFLFLCPCLRTVKMS